MPRASAVMTSKNKNDGNDDDDNNGDDIHANGMTYTSEAHVI